MRLVFKKAIVIYLGMNLHLGYRIQFCKSQSLKRFLHPERLCLTTLQIDGLAVVNSFKLELLELLELPQLG